MTKRRTKNYSTRPMPAAVGFCAMPVGCTARADFNQVNGILEMEAAP